MYMRVLSDPCCLCQGFVYGVQFMAGLFAVYVQTHLIFAVYVKALPTVYSL